MTEHDHSDNDAHGGPTSHPVPASLSAPIVPTGASATAHFDPVSLRPAIDAASLEGRLAELGASRSTAALGERADLLRMLGRLDEALAISEEAFRLAHFTGDRADSTAARIRRAYVFKEQGRLERALNDLHTSRISAATEEWHELEAAAAELEGYTLYDLGRYEEARGSLTAALAAYEKAGAPADRTNGLRVAIEGVMRAILQGSAPAPEPEPAPLVEPTDEVREPMVTPVIVDAPGTLGGETIGGETIVEAYEVDGPYGDDEDRNEDDEDEAVEGDTNPTPLFRTTGSPAFLGSPEQAPEAPARLDPATARLDPDAATDEPVPDAASIGVETQAIAVPHATAPGRSQRSADDEDRNEDDEPAATGFDAEVSRARKAARSIWGAFDASNQKTPPSDRS